MILCYKGYAIRIDRLKAVAGLAEVISCVIFDIINDIKVYEIVYPKNCKVYRLYNEVKHRIDAGRF